MFTVIKSNNKAWLKEANGNLIVIAPEYVDYWVEGAKVSEGEFKYRYEVFQQMRGCLPEWKEVTYAVYGMYLNEKRMFAIPAQDEAGLWAGIRKIIVDELYTNETTRFQATEIIKKLKSKYEIKRKQ